MRAAEIGLTNKTRFRLQDYRDVSGKFDRIVSVGMFEHVGPGFYDTFFRRCATLLDDDGVMLLSSIGRSEGPNVTNPWIAKYIFPGGYIPALSEVLPSVERAGLLVTDIEILRLHYAETLKAWREQFVAYRDAIECFYDPRFARMWEFYLAASEMAFRKQAMMVFQLQLARRQGVVPTTRDYIACETARLRTLDSAQRLPLRLPANRTDERGPFLRERPGKSPQSDTHPKLHIPNPCKHAFNHCLALAKSKKPRWIPYPQVRCRDLLIQVYGLDLCSFPRAPLHYVRQTALELSRQAIRKESDRGYAQSKTDGIRFSKVPRSGPVQLG